jgi:tetratricopeptide (TPR) repeat protein
LLPACSSPPGQRFADGVLLLLLTAVAFLLGCYEMGDSDIWWHLRGGEWILENQRAPDRDPFTFGSADKKWIDIHWGYEVVLALVHRVGGIGALVVLGATVGAAAFLACLTARRRDWPIAATVLCWTPALVLFAFRLDPRPEIFSLLYIGLYLAILWRLPQRPKLAWLLPAVQILWVNMQGLFILGPILLGLFVASEGARYYWERWFGTLKWDDAQRRWWLHVGGASAAVLAACLVNPYFLDGALFPLALLPKVTAKGNPYKSYIDELQSPQDLLKNGGFAVTGLNWFFLALYFLLALVPLSFLYPALWRAWRANHPARNPSTGVWLGGLAATVALLALGTVTILGRGAPHWVVVLGDNVPVLLLAGGPALALRIRRSSPQAALVAGVGALALAAWTAWLRVSLQEGKHGPLFEDNSPLFWGILAAGAALVAAGLVLRWGGSLFRILLAVAFSYLALQALQNWTRFALVAGTILAWNFGEWTAELAALRPASRPRSALAWALPAGLAAALVLWLVALATDRYYIHTGEVRHVAFREQPLEFPHEAVIFAGQSGMPDRALVYGLQPASVYTYHNSPQHKPYLDGRLEMPNQTTFETYVNVESWLSEGKPNWEPKVAAMGNPLLLLEHQNRDVAEAVLFSHPKWRCVYYDALASVFVPREVAADFPTLDFAGRHFHNPSAPSVPEVRGAAAREGRALYSVAARLPRPIDAARKLDVAWRKRIPILLVAIDRQQLVLNEEPDRPESWVILGNCYRLLNPHLPELSPAPANPWQLERDLYLAQETYCFRLALERHPEHLPAWRFLAESYQVRKMVDARMAAEAGQVSHDPMADSTAQEKMKQLQTELAAEPVPPAPRSAGELASAVTGLLRRHRPQAAANMLETAAENDGSSWPWPLAEQAAGLYMHLGRPADARRVWQQATDCPSAAVRACRLAATFWIERDFEAAKEQFQAARAADPRLAEPCWGLAMLHAQLGAADPARDACRAGLELSPNDRQRADLTALAGLLSSQEASP